MKDLRFQTKEQGMILISYSDENRQQAESLVDYLDENIETVMGCIAHSCGASQGDAETYLSSDRQRARFDKVKAVIAIISPDCSRKDEILFELGAAWALNLFILMIFLPGIDIREMPEQLSSSPFVDVDARDAHIMLRDATREITSLLGLTEKKGVSLFLSLDRTLKAMRNEQIWQRPSSRQDDDEDQDDLDED
ncbi:MAG: hypothetical protein LBO21_08570, partial [Synergistaceae bacterium]|nr:hypothetical protein [Synergistaceae bacterium]